MMDFLNFMSDGDHLIGACAFVLVCCYGLSWVVEAARGKKD